MTDVNPDRWTVPSESKLYWHSWGDEYVVYNDGSGDTHLLDSVAAETLQSLEKEPANLSELIARVAVSMGFEADRDLSAYLGKLLSNLCKLGLVIRIES